MNTAEKIIQHLSRLPESVQAEVLDFIEFIEKKQEKNQQESEDSGWDRLSLSYAMRGMEDESSPYSVHDIKEKFE